MDTLDLDEYPLDANAIQAIDVLNIVGLSTHIKLKFDRCFLRIYRVERTTDSFFCRIAIPGFEDDEGYSLELPCSEIGRSEPEPKDNSRHQKFEYDPDEDAMINIDEYEPEFEPTDDYFDEYSVFNCGLSFDDLANNASFEFKESFANGRHYLLLDVRIKGTPYRGYALLEDELYRKIRKI